MNHRMPALVWRTGEGGLRLASRHGCGEGFVVEGAITRHRWGASWRGRDVASGEPVIVRRLAAGGVRALPRVGGWAGEGAAPLRVAGHVGSDWLLVHRRVPGTSLRRRWQAAGPRGFAPSEVADMARAMLARVGRIHTLGEAHGTLGVWSWLVDPDGRLHLVDRGLSAWRLGERRGAPWDAAGAEPDAAADLRAVGRLVERLLDGVGADAGASSILVRGGDARPPIRWGGEEETEAALRRWIRCVVGAPTPARPADAHAALGALERAVRGVAPGAGGDGTTLPAAVREVLARVDGALPASWAARRRAAG